MNRTRQFMLMLAMVVLVVAMSASTALAMPGYALTTPMSSSCVSCHPANAAYTINLGAPTVAGDKATYDFTMAAGPADPKWIVYKGTTPVQEGTGVAGTFVVDAATDYSLYVMSTTVKHDFAQVAFTTPAAEIPPVPATIDTIAPKTVSDIADGYSQVGDLNIKFTATDSSEDTAAAFAGVGIKYLYYQVDKSYPHVELNDTKTITLWAPGDAMSQTYAVKYWSQDATGNVEAINTIKVTVFNPAPVAVHRAYSVDANGILEVAAPGLIAGIVDAPSHNASASVEATLVTAPTNGVVVIGADGSFSYTPNAGFSGTDSFEYAATDGFAVGNPAKVDLTVNAAVVPPTGITVNSYSGANRYDTALLASQKNFVKADTVVIATGASFPDALGGASLAGAVNGPLLLTPTADVPQNVLDEIKHLGATKIYVLGGEAAVSKAAFNELDGVIAGTPKRLGGADRYATAKLVANETISLLGTSYSGKAFLATGANFPDALAASPISAAAGMPVILVNSAGQYSLPTAVKETYILGGTAVVPTSAQGATFKARLAGADRYATAAAVAKYGVTNFGLTWANVGVATGENFPDALAAGPALGQKDAVLLLTRSGALSGSASDALTANKAAVSVVDFFGGKVALTDAVRNAVLSILK